jgi:hypothetical protein
MIERENLGVGIYQFLIVVVFIFCLIGAFVLPSAITSSRFLAWFGIGGLLAIPFLSILADKNRVRNAVEDRDGILVSRKRVPNSWGAAYSRFRTRYELEYIDLPEQPIAISVNPAGLAAWNGWRMRKFRTTLCRRKRIDGNGAFLCKRRRERRKILTGNQGVNFHSWLNANKFWVKNQFVR